MGADLVHHRTDVLVIGGGAAGAMAAIRAREAGVDVLLVDKSVFGKSGCAAVASGAYVTYTPGDDIMRHLGGRGVLTDQRAAIDAIHATHDLLQLLDQWGVRFVKDGKEIWLGGSDTGRAASGGLTAGLSGGGGAMMKVVSAEAMKRGVRVVNRVMVVDLLTSDGKLPTDGEVVGAIGISGRNEEVHVFEAKTVLVCAGGFNFGYKRPGQPFAGMPIDLTSDGIAMELRAGAAIGNMAVGSKYLQTQEFICAPGIEHFTVQEVDWVNRHGENVMKRFKEVEDESSRRLSVGNAVAYGILSGTGPVSLDCRKLTFEQKQFLWDVIPIIMQTFERADYDLTEETVPYLPVLPGTYGSSWGGGAVLDEQCMTSIPGLFAAGASSDGRNISPSLNLSWCMVLGWWAAEHAANFAKSDARTGEVQPAQVEQLAEEYVAYMNPKRQLSFNDMHHEAASALEDLGVILNDAKLAKTKTRLTEILQQCDQSLGARDPHGLVKALGLRNSIQVETVVMQYFLHRKESRGTVLNSDHPETDNENWLSLTRSKMRRDGALEFWDDPVPRDFYVHYRPRSGKRLHPFFKAVGVELFARERAER